MAIGYIESYLVLVLCLSQLGQTFSKANMTNIDFVLDQNNVTITEHGVWPEVQCKVQCNPECDVTWKKDGNIVSYTGLLSLRNLSVAVTGEYICVVRHKGKTHPYHTKRSLFVNRISESGENDTTEGNNENAKNNKSEEQWTVTMIVLVVFVGLLSLISITLFTLLVWFKYRCSCGSQRTCSSDNGTNNETNPDRRISEFRIYENLQICS